MQIEIKGTPLPVAICHLQAGESIITEKGAMSWMSSNLEMQTKGGGVGKMFSRALQGEAMFQNIYTAVGAEGMIAMGSSFPGEINNTYNRTEISFSCKRDNSCERDVLP